MVAIARQGLLRDWAEAGGDVHRHHDAPSHLPDGELRLQGTYADSTMRLRVVKMSL
jgi:hypothetical protein